MEKSRGWKLAGILLVAAVAIWVLVAFGLGILLPFILGYLAAQLAEPLVRRLETGSRLPRWTCSGLGITMVLLVLSLAAVLLGRVLLTEAVGLAGQLPQWLQSVQTPWKELKLWLMDLVMRAPDGLDKLLRRGLEQLFDNGSLFLEKGSELMLTAATWVIGALPDLLLFSLTAVLASFMISSRLPQIRQTVERHLPKLWQTRIAQGYQRLKGALGGWFKAQLKLMGITFLILTAGFILLGVAYPVFLAGILSLVDALPVLGIGTALIPWAVVSFLGGDVQRGIGLMILYGVAALTRTGLEPRLIGRQIGLNPLLTLFAMYAGYRLCGLLGMVLFPVAAIMLQQFAELWTQAGK